MRQQQPDLGEDRGVEASSKQVHVQKPASRLCSSSWQKLCSLLTDYKPSSSKAFNIRSDGIMCTAHARSNMRSKVGESRARAASATGEGSEQLNSNIY